ncbi:hypothetical protein LCGC14_1394000 [marine sediment metagenome]|uniref:Uncharacterized protein n=1 Tax=marine sediment metagenome TaxID=412755 RepID=A0A0F9JZ39_9ZZZZ
MKNALVRYDAARKALVAAKNVDDVKKIRNTAEAARAYARQAKNKELEIDAAEIRLRAERRLGEFLIAQKERGGGLNRGMAAGAKRKPSGTFSEPLDATPTLEEMGIDKKLSSRAQRNAAIPEELYEAQLDDWRERVSRAAERVTISLARDSRPGPCGPFDPTLDELTIELRRLTERWPEKHRPLLILQLRGLADELEPPTE